MPAEPAQVPLAHATSPLACSFCPERIAGFRGRYQLPGRVQLLGQVGRGQHLDVGGEQGGVLGGWLDTVQPAKGGDPGPRVLSVQQLGSGLRGAVQPAWKTPGAAAATDLDFRLMQNGPNWSAFEHTLPEERLTV